jgi:hypothetical protein
MIDLLLGSGAQPIKSPSGYEPVDVEFRTARRRAPVKNIIRPRGVIASDFNE